MKLAVLNAEFKLSLDHEEGSTQLTKQWVEESQANNISLRNLCVLCASAVKKTTRHVNRRGAEHAEITQRNIASPKLLRPLFC